MQMIEDYKIPLVIGVTGHRDIDPNNTELLEWIKSELRKLQADYPNTPFVIMSPLAEGADRLLVRMAQKCLNNPPLIVPLPLPVDLYCQDFATEQSKAEFQELLKNAADSIVVDWPNSSSTDCSHAEAGDIQGEMRNQQYAKAGAYVVEHSQILFAIWDGQPSKGTGGTAEVVGWARDRRIPSQYSTLPGSELLDSLSPNLVVQINPKEPNALVLNKPEDQQQTLNAFQHLDRFNRDAADFSRDHLKKCRASQANLLGDEAEQSLFKPDNLPWLLSVYAVADAMAIHYQHKNRFCWIVIYSIFAAAVTCFGLIDLCPTLVWIYLVGFVITWICYRFLKRHSYEDRFLDYRALAEGLRVEFFWRINKVKSRVSANYLRKHRGALSWIRFSLANAEKIILLHSLSGEVYEPQALELTEKLWINSQKLYFATKQKTLQPCIKRLNRIVSNFFFLMLITAFVYGIATVFPVGFDNLIFKYFDSTNKDNFFQALIGFCGAISLIAETYKTRETLEEIQKQYALLAPLYQNAGEQIREGIRPPPDILLDLGKEALQENGEWLWWHRQQPDEPPKG
ncbi:MAG: hypothetical protein ACU85E_11285 [Gammaproteobacteria bacterium]